MSETDSKAVVINTDELKVLVKLSVVEVFSEDATLEKVKSYMESLLQPFRDALVHAKTEIDTLKSEVADKGRTIQKLSADIEDLERKYDDIEQHGRKRSVRVFGIPENTRGDTDSKVLHVINEVMQLDPPISINDLEVTHRVGKPSLPSGQIDQPAKAAQPVSPEVAAEAPVDNAEHPGDVTLNSGESSSRGDPQIRSKRLLPRPILVKFVSRRVKADVMVSRKHLKGRKLCDSTGHETSIYIQDDLTQRRVNLAYQARQLKNNNRIADTWVSYGKIMIKDCHNHITVINCSQDLSKFQ